MVSLKPALLLSLCAVFAAANPIAFEKRQGTRNIGQVRCADTRYSRKQIDEATAEGCRLYAADQQLGSNQYPHRFNNREGIAFATSGPYQEFPITSSGNYTGRAPGPDRVVFDPDYRGRCVFVGAMTHTDAPLRNGFVACNESTSTSGGGGGGSAASGITPAAFAAILPALSMLALTA